MKSYIGNAFASGMIKHLVTPGKILNVSVSPCLPIHIPINAISCIGHESTALALTALLEREVKMNRIAVNLEVGDVIYVTALMQGDKPFRCEEGKVLSTEDFEEIGVTMEILKFWVNCQDDADLEGMCQFNY